jgi:hypothetical protein
MLTVIAHSRWIELFKEATQKGSDGNWSKSLNMADEVNYLVFDILGDLCFGKNFNMKEPESDLKHVPELMATYLQILQPVSITNIAFENTVLMQTNVNKLSQSQLTVLSDRLRAMGRLLGLAEASRTRLSHAICDPGEDDAVAEVRRPEPREPH